MIIHRLRRALMLLALTLFFGVAAQAADPSVQSVTLAERGHDLLLNADVSLDLNSQMTDAAERGLPLYFTVDVEIRRPRWYWFDETVLSSSQAWRIEYNPLTRQWRVHSGNLALPVSSLSEALSVVRHVRNWRIGESAALHPDTDYEGSIRVRFDVQLSKAVNALGSSEWSLSTPWTDFPVNVMRAVPAAAPAPDAVPMPVLPVAPGSPPALPAPSFAPPQPPAASGPRLELPARPGGGLGLSAPPPEAP